MNLASGDRGLSFLFQTAWTRTQVECCPVEMTELADPRTPRCGTAWRVAPSSPGAPWGPTFFEPPTCLHPAALSGPGLFLSPGLRPRLIDGLRRALTHLGPMLGARLCLFVFLMLLEFFVCGLQPRCGRIPASFTSQLQDGKRKTLT